VELAQHLATDQVAVLVAALLVELELVELLALQGKVMSVEMQTMQTLTLRLQGAVAALEQ
jgi:hypothetical protein